MTKTPKSLSFALILLLGTVAPALGQQQESADIEPGATPYLLGPSDVIRVWVWEEPDLTASVTVRPDGKVSLPLAGEVDVAGRTPKAVEEEISAKLADYVNETLLVVVVIVEQINSPQISVLGEVRTPNRYPLRQQLSLLDALALAGGFTEFANRDEVIVFRREGDGVRRMEVDVKRFLDGNSDALMWLQPGDTVYVR
jgi:polysaccharide export outer membrane protein